MALDWQTVFRIEGEMLSIFKVRLITNYRLRFVSRDTSKGVMRRRELGLKDNNCCKN
jgi:hypothetical protein